jgi:hypothetical protein
MKTGYNALYRGIIGKELQTEEKVREEGTQQEGKLEERNTMAVSNFTL